MNEYLKPFIPLVHFLGAYLGKSTEVVLHDLTDWNYSVVAIENGHVSGRTIGSPVTDLALKIINEGRYRHEPYMTGYISKGTNGHVLKSATFFIRNPQDELVGMMCINSDCQDIVRVRDMLDMVIQNMNIPETTGEIAENFTGNVNDLIEANFRKVCDMDDEQIIAMKHKEKIEIVAKLETMGTFLMKGAVSDIAQRLHISVPTLYRYLNHCKNGEN